MEVNTLNIWVSLGRLPSPFWDFRWKRSATEKKNLRRTEPAEKPLFIKTRKLKKEQKKCDLLRSMPVGP